MKNLAIPLVYFAGIVSAIGALNHPQLRTTFELISAVIWVLAGAGFLVACLTPVRQPQTLARTPLRTIT